MLRPLENARTLRPGTDDPIIRMQGCPDCGGWGWICTNPFARFNRKIVQCPTCEDAKRHFDAVGSLPVDIQAALDKAVGDSRGTPGVADEVKR